MYTVYGTHWLSSVQTQIPDETGWDGSDNELVLIIMQIRRRLSIRLDLAIIYLPAC